MGIKFYPLSYPSIHTNSWFAKTLCKSDSLDRSSAQLKLFIPVDIGPMNSLINVEKIVSHDIPFHRYQFIPRWQLV